MPEELELLLFDEPARLRVALESVRSGDWRLSVNGPSLGAPDGIDLGAENGIMLDLRPGGTGPAVQPTYRLAILPLGNAVLVATRSPSETAARDPLGPLRSVAKARAVLTADATSALIQSLLGATQQDARSLGELSDREREVVTLTAAGYTALEIGRRLFLSPKTVETYRSRIMKKLGFRHRSELVQFAVRVGLWSSLATHHP